MRRQSSGLSLRGRLVTLVAIAVLPAALASMTFLTGEADVILRHKADRELELTTRNLASNVRAWDQYMVLALDNLRGIPEIVSMDPALQRPVLEHMGKVYDRLIVLGTTDTSGRSIARSDSLPSLDYREREWFRGAIAGKPITRQVVLSLTTRNASVAYAAPVRNAAGTVVGTVFCTMDQRDVLREVGAGRFGQTGYSFVVDERGIAVAHPMSESPALSDYGDFAPVRTVLASSATAAGVFSDAHGERWLYRTARLANGWTVVGVQSENEVLAEGRHYRQVAAVVISGSLLLAFALIWIVSGRTLTPIRRLTDAVQALASGQWGQTVPAGAPGELGGLAAAFNAMSRQLHGAYRTFEDRVVERTRELERANLNLQASRGELQAALGRLGDSEREFRTTFEPPAWEWRKSTPTPSASSASTAGSARSPATTSRNCWA